MTNFAKVHKRALRTWCQLERHTGTQGNPQTTAVIVTPCPGWLPQSANCCTSTPRRVHTTADMLTVGHQQGSAVPEDAATRKGCSQSDRDWICVCMRTVAKVPVTLVCMVQSENGISSSGSRAWLPRDIRVTSTPDIPETHPDAAQNHHHTAALPAASLRPAGRSGACTTTHRCCSNLGGTWN